MDGILTPERVVELFSLLETLSGRLDNLERLRSTTEELNPSLPRTPYQKSKPSKRRSSLGYLDEDDSPEQQKEPGGERVIQVMAYNLEKIPKEEMMPRINTREVRKVLGLLSAAKTQTVARNRSLLDYVSMDLRRELVNFIHLRKCLGSTSDLVSTTNLTKLDEIQLLVVFQSMCRPTDASDFPHKLYKAVDELVVKIGRDGADWEPKVAGWDQCMYAKLNAILDQISETLDFWYADIPEHILKAYPPKGLGGRDKDANPGIVRIVLNCFGRYTECFQNLLGAEFLSKCTTAEELLRELRARNESLTKQAQEVNKANLSLKSPEPLQAQFRAAKSQQMQAKFEAGAVWKKSGVEKAVPSRNTRPVALLLEDAVERGDTPNQLEDTQVSDRLEQEVSAGKDLDEEQDLEFEEQFCQLVGDYSRTPLKVEAQRSLVATSLTAPKPVKPCWMAAMGRCPNAPETCKFSHLVGHLRDFVAEVLPQLAASKYNTTGMKLTKGDH